MTLRQFIDIAYAIAVEELREAGMSLSDAVRKVDEILRPVVPVEVDPMAERIHRARQNEPQYARLRAMTNTTPGRRVVRPA